MSNILPHIFVLITEKREFGRWCVDMIHTAGENVLIHHYNLSAYDLHIIV